MCGYNWVSAESKLRWYTFRYSGTQLEKILECFQERKISPDCCGKLEGQRVDLGRNPLALHWLCLGSCPLPSFLAGFLAAGQSSGWSH